MALSLQQYAEHLDERGEPQPAGPEPKPVPAKPHAPPLGVRAAICGGRGVAWLAAADPELLPADAVMRKIAFDKTVSEFKMWPSMPRKPGEPGEVLTHMVAEARERLVARLIGGGGGEPSFGMVWRGVLDRLLQREYVYDAGFFGALDEYAEKIALYCQRAACGMAALPGARDTLRLLAAQGVKVGLRANGQTATPALLTRAFAAQGPVSSLGELFAPALTWWSHELGSPIETERGWAEVERSVAAAGLRPEEVVCVGCDVARDVLPARRRGFRTALLAADRASVKVRSAQLKDDATKPDALLTEFSQLALLCAA